MRRVLAIADDLTGALEAGAKFAARGLAAIVTREPEYGSTHPVLVVDTESRHLPAAEAAARVAGACGAGGEILYKKTDSTLRGNIGAELGAMLAAYPGASITYVPAYPAVGRTVRGGVLYVDGVDVGASAFSRDALNPVTESSIAAVLGAVECAIHDGESQDDVLRATAAGLATGNPPILAGPASVAEAIAELLSGRGEEAAPLPRIARCLIVNGSRHEVSERQVAFVEEHACESWAVLRPHIPEGCTADEAAERIGAAVVERLNTQGADAILIFGGDTAFGILKALGASALEPLGEVVTGVPISRVVGRNLMMITKAGGFGGERLVRQIWERLHGDE